MARDVISPLAKMVDQRPEARWPIYVLMALTAYGLLRGLTTSEVVDSAVHGTLAAAAAILICGLILFALLRWRTPGMFLALGAAGLAPAAGLVLWPWWYGHFGFGPESYDVMVFGMPAGYLAQVVHHAINAIGHVLMAAAIVALTFEASRGVYARSSRRAAVASRRDRPPPAFLQALRRWPLVVLAAAVIGGAAAALHYWHTGLPDPFFGMVDVVGPDYGMDQLPLVSAAFGLATATAGLVIASIIALWWHYRTRGLAWLTAGLALLPLLNWVFSYGSFLWSPHYSAVQAGLGRSVLRTALSLPMILGSAALFLGLCYLTLELRAGTYAVDDTEAGRSRS